MKPKITIVWPTPPMPMTFRPADGKIFNPLDCAEKLIPSAEKFIPSAEKLIPSGT
jgi:hypothetical protein